MSISGLKFPKKTSTLGLSSRWKRAPQVYINSYHKTCPKVLKGYSALKVSILRRKVEGKWSEYTLEFLVKQNYFSGSEYQCEWTFSFHARIYSWSFS